ncbi:MAG: hypothetical protein F6J93_17060 [Oscillatoria sp. SIO1A7]|nr:hypothetical protein [Oscillatoria sp. SIO1A7]
MKNFKLAVNFSSLPRRTQSARSLSAPDRRDARPTNWVICFLEFPKYLCNYLDPLIYHAQRPMPDALCPMAQCPMPNNPYIFL